MEPSSGTCVLAEGKTAVAHSSPSDPLFIGPTKFEYKACLDDEIELACDMASVNISVEAPIVTRDDIVSVISTTNGTRIDFLQNDFKKPLGQQLTVKETMMEPSSGTCVLAKCKIALIYSVPSNLLFIGREFEYKVCLDDGLELACDRVSVIICFEPVRIEHTSAMLLIADGFGTSF